MPDWPRPAQATDPATRATGLTPGQQQRLQAAARAIRDGAPAQALQLMDSVLAEAAEHPEALRLRGLAHARAHQYEAARVAYQHALALWPGDPLTLSDFASTQQAIGDTDAALALWRQACAATPTFAMGWFNLGRNLQVLGHTDAAIAALERAGTLDGHLLPAHVLLGDALAHAGRFDDAERAYRRALALHPACGDAWRGLSNMKTRTLSPDDRRQLETQLARHDLIATDRIALGFALGKLSEDLGDYAAAFVALNAANTQQSQLAPWRADAFHALVDAVLAASATLPPPVEPALGSEVIFIVGLPRSGSTLFEQILAAHPQVEGASELPDLPAVLAEESARRGQPFPHWLHAASAADWQRLGRRYLERTARWRERRPRHTDKLPENWLYAGLLGAMLPGARVIDTRRDAVETGWSLFKQAFHRLPHFACSLTDIAAYTRDHDAAMNHWQAAAPARIRIQSYEALLADPACVIADLLAFCALPFDPACLDYPHAVRAVRTPSASQVRQPLNRQTARAAHYGALLDPLRRWLD